MQKSKGLKNRCIRFTLKPQNSPMTEDCITAGVRVPLRPTAPGHREDGCPRLQCLLPRLSSQAKEEGPTAAQRERARPRSPWSGPQASSYQLQNKIFRQVGHGGDCIYTTGKCKHHLSALPPAQLLTLTGSH